MEWRLVKRNGKVYAEPKEYDKWTGILFETAKEKKAWYWLPVPGTDLYRRNVSI